MNVRPAAVAGQFYPADPVALRQQLQELFLQKEYPRRTPLTSSQPPTDLLQDRSEPDPVTAKPRALIVPHAGYRYSGPVAAAAYATLHPDDYRRVLLLGPAHRVFLRGIALPCVAAFTTPLGEVPLLANAWQLLQPFDWVQLSDDAHADEHALEVQLPFLQARLEAFELIPLVVGDCTPEQVAAVIEALADANTLIVISTDLSHFHPYDEARQLDTDTVDQILQAATTLQLDQACGAMPLNGFLHYLHRHPGQLRLLAMDNSGDHGGPRQRVVGYASFRVD